MDTDTNEVYRNLDDVPKERKNHVVSIPKEFEKAAERVLNGRYKAVAVDDTEAGRKLIEFARKAKRRQRNKAARKARRKTRSRGK